MARGDRRGPLGQGPKTGRAAGFCSGSSEPGFTDRFFGCRSGRGRRWNNQGAQSTNNSNDVTDQLKSLKEQLNSIEKRIKG